MKKVILLICVLTLVLCSVSLTACKSKDEAAPLVPNLEGTTPDECFLFSLMSDGTYKISAISANMPEKVVIPASHEGKNVTVLESHGFKECNTIEEVVLPESITKISLGAFYECRALKTITIPKSVTYLAYLSFYGCNALTDVYYSGTIKEWKDITDNGAFTATPTIHCSDGDIAK